MNHPRPSQPAVLDRRALLRDALLLLGVAILAGAAIAFYQTVGGAPDQAGMPQPARGALVAAVLVTGHAVVLAYLATILGPRHSPAGALLGIGFRTGVPMAALVMVSEAGPAWSAHGFGGYLVACYLPCLAAETVLVARRLHQRNQRNRKSSASPALTGPSS